MREFTQEDAIRLIAKMRAYYGKKFADQWSGVDPKDIAESMVECFQGLTADDFKRGVTKMMKSTFCPSIPEFRSWCEPKAVDWLDAHEAWAIAKDSIEFGTGREMTVIWTEQAAKAFERCSDLVATGDKFQLAEAKKIFVSIYERLVTEAKDQGLKPVYNVSLGVDPDQCISAIKQAEVAGFLTTQETQLQLEHKQTKAEEQADADRYKTTAQKAIAELREKLKLQAPVNKMVDEIKEVQPWELKPDSEYWPDPFDDQQEYLKNLKADGKAVPMALGGAA
ncbi:hypothetical protein MMP61_18630 [Acinetobacter sp. NIPH 1958]|uniref:hypothetical protein n=1 Tax=Acinetobacter sp. NIPH 1958 TaxID=2923430 RepID=UPI001F4ADCD6|nr:hypothetical protein [Acinetobacter sp. NIPH 1958]MCH7357555.1 hypothetical protein [Acinetobacter sp. NIPH 1958]